MRGDSVFSLVVFVNFVNQNNKIAVKLENVRKLHNRDNVVDNKGSKTTVSLVAIAVAVQRFTGK